MTVRAASPFPTKRLKHVVSLRQLRVNGNEDSRPYLGLENIEPWTGALLRESSITTVEATSLSNTFERGDVLFGKLRPYLAKVWVAEFSGRSTTEFLVMKPVEVESRFLGYVCLSRDFIDRVDASTFGSKMPRADWDFIGNMPVPVPEALQQHAIADYLDRETTRLDALVAEKERVLTLLEEKRVALVTRAVTRGLDTHVSLRDSTIPSVEEIPEHWRTTRLRHVTAAVEQGWSPEAVNYQPKLDEWGVLKLNAVNRSRFDETATKTLPADLMPRQDLEIHRGDVLITRSNTPALVGDACFVETTRPKLMLSDIIYRLTVDYHVVDGKFLVYFLTIPTGRIQIEHDARGTSASMVKISRDHIRNWHIPVPPLCEQRAIVDYLDRETVLIDGLVAQIRETIVLLKERRSSLIAAAVTGQIDVEHSA